jgi:hypothetical protein
MKFFGDGESDAGRPTGDKGLLFFPVFLQGVPIRKSPANFPCDGGQMPGQLDSFGEHVHLVAMFPVNPHIFQRDPAMKPILIQRL